MNIEYVDEQKYPYLTKKEAEGIEWLAEFAVETKNKETLIRFIDWHKESFEDHFGTKSGKVFQTAMLSGSEYFLDECGYGDITSAVKAHDYDKAYKLCDVVMSA